MNLVPLLSLGLTGITYAAVVTAPKTSSASGSKQPQQQNISAKQVAESKSGKISEFLTSMQNRVGKVENKAAVAKTAQKQGKPVNKLSRKERKAARKAGRKDARKSAAGAGVAKKAAADPEEEEIFSLSLSASAEEVRRCTNHFSFSESEHYRDCSSTSSGSSSSSRGKKGSCKKNKDKKKKKAGYRLRHVRVHAEASRLFREEGSASGSLSIDLGILEGLASASASEEYKRSHTVVLRCCEDELSRRRKCDGRYVGPACDYDPYARVDYRKKVYFHDDSEERFSASASVSASIDLDLGVGGGVAPAAPVVPDIVNGKIPSMP